MQFLSKITQNRNIKNNPEQCGFYLEATSAYFCFFCIDTIQNTEKLSWTEVLTEKLKISAIKKYCKSQMLDNQEKERNKGQKFCTGRIVMIAITTSNSMRVKVFLMVLPFSRLCVKCAFLNFIFNHPLFFIYTFVNFLLIHFLWFSHTELILWANTVSASGSPFNKLIYVFAFLIYMK